MEEKSTNKKSQSSSLPEADCEHCLYYDWDENEEEMVCRMNLDEDEYYSLLSSGRRRCRYFRFYDEYKSVQKQI